MSLASRSHSEAPSPGWLRLTASTSFINAAFALSGLVIREADFAQGRFSESHGPLYVPFIASTALLCGGVFSVSSNAPDPEALAGPAAAT